MSKEIDIYYILSGFFYYIYSIYTDKKLHQSLQPQIPKTSYATIMQYRFHFYYTDKQIRKF